MQNTLALRWAVRAMTAVIAVLSIYGIYLFADNGYLYSGHGRFAETPQSPNAAINSTVIGALILLLLQRWADVIMRRGGRGRAWIYLVCVLCVLWVLLSAFFFFLLIDERKEGAIMLYMLQLGSILCTMFYMPARRHRAVAIALWVIVGSTTLMALKGVIEAKQFNIGYFSGPVTQYQPEPNSLHAGRIQNNMIVTSREFDSVIKGRKHHFTDNWMYWPDSNVFSHQLSDYTSSIAIYQRHHRNGVLSYKGQYYLKAMPDPDHPNHFLTRFGMWYKYDSSSHLEDSSDAIKSVYPRWWDARE